MSKWENPHRLTHIFSTSVLLIFQSRKNILWAILCIIRYLVGTLTSALYGPVAKLSCLWRIRIFTHFYKSPACQLVVEYSTRKINICLVSISYQQRWSLETRLPKGIWPWPNLFSLVSKGLSLIATFSAPSEPFFKLSGVIVQRMAWLTMPRQVSPLPYQTGEICPLGMP